MWQSSRSSSKAWASVRWRLEGDHLLSSAELDDILAQILTLPLPPTRLRTDEVGQTLVILAQKLPYKSELLVSDFNQVIRHCFKEKLMLTQDQLDALIPFFVAALTHCPSWYAEQTILTLGVVLLENAERARNHHDVLFTTLRPYLDATSADVGARYAASSCLAQVVTVLTDDCPSFVLTMWKIVMDNFLHQCRQLHSDVPTMMMWTTERIYYKTCIASAQCLEAMMKLKDAGLARYMDADVTVLLQCLRQCLGCGLTFSHATVDGGKGDRLYLSSSDSDSSSSLDHHGSKPSNQRV